MKMPTTPKPRELEEAIARYWALAYAEGKEGRDHDTEDGAAQRCWSEIQAGIEAFALQYAESVREACAQTVEAEVARAESLLDVQDCKGPLFDKNQVSAGIAALHTVAAAIRQKD